MADPPTKPAFPNDNALCERCGYPLKGLASDAVCPECGYAVIESSPIKRTLRCDQASHGLGQYFKLAPWILRRPKATFQSLAIDGSQLAARRFLFWSATLAAVYFTAILWAGGLWQATIHWHGYSLGQLIASYFAVVAAVYLLTYIEMLGVTTFSKRRGWRVPFSLAERICCLVSVAWLPGVIVAAIGFSLLQEHGVGHRWFEQLLGLVRVGWLVYGGLFVLSLLWFETLVWIAVRQVRFANAWPDPGQTPAPDTP
jgi:hypothetical protein